MVGLLTDFLLFTVNFLGPMDEFVVSGSDDGNFFIWEKQTGKLVDILHGDDQVVNVIEGHPYLPLMAVSGIDTTVKVSDDATGGPWMCADHVSQLFAPTHRLPSAFSRMRDAESIIRNNQQNSERRIDLGTLLMYARIARRVSGAGTGPGGDEECTTQ